MKKMVTVLNLNINLMSTTPWRIFRRSVGGIMKPNLVWLPLSLTVFGPLGALGAGECGTATSVYVIDATRTLYQFDSHGALLNKVSLPSIAASSIGNLDGGGITVDDHNIYVTLGEPANSVVAYDKHTLAPVTLAAGAFGGLFVPREIVYDAHNQQFYVANGGSTVTAYDASGAPVSTSFTQGPTSGIYGPSGIAFDPTFDALWVANYTGGTGSLSPTFGVDEFTEGGVLESAFNYATQFTPPDANNAVHEMPYAIAYHSANGQSPATVTVGFISDGTGLGKGELGTYLISGSLIAQFGGGVTNPNAISSESNGDTYVADNSGLLIYNAAGAQIGPSSHAFTGLTAPIYGVFVSESER
jgi:DNA-binding beta-propeller fold protein YncE